MKISIDLGPRYKDGCGKGDVLTATQWRSVTSGIECLIPVVREIATDVEVIKAYPTPLGVELEVIITDPLCRDTNGRFTRECLTEGFDGGHVMTAVIRLIKKLLAQKNARADVHVRAATTQLKRMQEF